MEDRVQEIVSWLYDGWHREHPIAVIEGFAGIGKSTAANHYFRAWKGPKVSISLVEGTLYEDFLLELVSEIEAAGLREVVDDSDWEKAVVRAIASRELLLVLRKFESQLDADGLVSSAEMRRFLGRLSSAPRGRVCIVCAHSPRSDQWTSNAQYRTMEKPTIEQGSQMLREMARERGKLDELDDDLIGEVSAWLGNNPRAIRAFVGCLVSQSVEEIIDRDSESWEFRHRPRSAALTEELEHVFWRQSIGHLDPESVTLTENLSVYRKPFRVEAIQAAGATIANWESAKNRLTLSFILERRGAWYELNPIVRQLAASRLGESPRRNASAHRRAADFFAKRLSNRSHREETRTAGNFVEARYHYLEGGYPKDLDAIASDYRGLLLQTYRSSAIDLSSPSEARARIPVLLAALDHDDPGYEKLRGALVQLLETRGGAGDDHRAMHQARIASQARLPLSFWLSYARIASRVETDAFLVAMAKRSLEKCTHEPERIVVKISEQLFLRGQHARALGVLRDASAKIGGHAVAYLKRLESFILERTGRFPEAYEVLMSFHETNGPGGASDLLLEEATFLAYQHSDSKRLAAISRYARGLNDQPKKHPAILSDMLQCMLLGDYEAARALGEQGKSDVAVASQLAFCCLSEGECERATKLLPDLDHRRNQPTWWLTALIALYSGDGDTYLGAIEKASGRNLDDAEVADVRLWLYLWDEVPESMRPYPSFYFPRIPSRLTGLSRDLVRTFHGGAQRELIAEVVPLDTEQRGRGGSERVMRSASINPDRPGGDPDGTSGSKLVVNGDLYMNSSSGNEYYTNSGQTGFIGRDGRIEGDVSQVQMGQPDLDTCMLALSRAARADDEHEVADVLQELQDRSIELGVDRSDEKFKKVRWWVMEKLTDTSLAVAAGVVLATFGMN